MNLFEIFNNAEYANCEILQGENLSLIKCQIAPIYCGLAKNPVKNVIIVSKNYKSFFVNFLAAILAKKEIFITDDIEKTGIKNIENFEYILLDEINAEKSPKTLPEAPFPLVLNLDEIFINVFTSGSTGVPKRVRKSLLNILVEAENILSEFEIKEKTVLKASVPLHHMFGLSIAVGFCLELPGVVVFDTKEVLFADDESIKNSIFVSSPSFLDKIMKTPPMKDFAPKIVLSAGDKLKKETFEFFLNNGAQIKDIYGSTEVGCIGYKSCPDEEFLKCFPKVEVKTDEKSRLVVISPYFTGGEFVLQDMVKVKDSSHFQPIARMDRIVKIQEKRVNLETVEKILKEGAKVDAAYCFKHGEKLACAVVLNENSKKEFIKTGKIEIIKKLKAEIFKKQEIAPQRWVFLYEIPKTKSGKINKDKIKEIFSTNLSYPFVLDVQTSKTFKKITLMFEKSSNFFKGHFENYPITPGVVQLYYAQKFGACFAPCFEFNSVKRVKFSNIIKPDEIVNLNFEITEKGLKYTYSNENTVYSSGLFSKKEI